MNYIRNANGRVLVPSYMKRQGGFVVGPALFGTADYKDPYWANVKSLIYYNGTNGSKTITDEITSNSWTTEGTAALSTAKRRFGSASLLVGTGGVTTATVFPLSTGDFTIEGFVYLTAQGGVFGIFGNSCPNIVFTSGGGIQISNASIWIYSSGATIALNTWTHIAVCKFGSNCGIFIGGVMCYNAAWSNGSYTGSAFLGSNGLSQPITGYLDSTRITIGVARYTASFAPPVNPFPNHG